MSGHNGNVSLTHSVKHMMRRLNWWGGSKAVRKEWLSHLRSIQDQASFLRSFGSNLTPILLFYYQSPSWTVTQSYCHCQSLSFCVIGWTTEREHWELCNQGFFYSFFTWLARSNAPRRFWMLINFHCRRRKNTRSMFECQRNQSPPSLCSG